LAINFKKDAESHTRGSLLPRRVVGIDENKLYVTIFEGSPLDEIPRDDEAEQLWLCGRCAPGTHPCMGNEGQLLANGRYRPLRACSEIHYDMGPAASDQEHPDCEFGCECGRYVEIWNLVFNADDRYERFRRICLGLGLLPKPSIETGAGLRNG